MKCLSKFKRKKQPSIEPMTLLSFGTSVISQFLFAMSGMDFPMTAMVYLSHINTSCLHDHYARFE